MEISGFNLLLLLLLAFVGAIVVVQSVRNTIDSKLSNITVPEFTPQNILIQTEDGKIKRITLDKDGVAEASAEVTENFESISIEKSDVWDHMKENPIQSTIIATDSSKPKVWLRQGYFSVPSDRNMVNRDHEIINPDHNDILRYNGPGCYERVDTRDIRKAQLVKKPPVQRCKGQIQSAAVNTVRTRTLTADGKIVEQNVSYYVPSTYLENAGVRSGMPTGYPEIDNIAREYGEPADVDQIGAVPVNNYEGEPVPIGSIFMD